MKIITLVENTTDKTRCDLKSQHGISLYIETLGKKILFDAGKDGLFSENAEKLNVNIADIDYLVLSHAHYDHTGGLKTFLDKNSKGKIILNENCLSDYYSKLCLFIYKYIGLDKSLYKKYKDRFVTIKDNYELTDSIYILNNTETDGHRPIGNKRLFGKAKGRYVLDDFSHEIIMAVKENEDWIILTGCSHSGITNMLSSFRKVYPENKIKALLGGFHLMNPLTKKMVETQEMVQSIGKEISKFKIDKIYTGHCTGEEAFVVLHNYLGDRIDTFRTGKEINI